MYGWDCFGETRWFLADGFKDSVPVSLDAEFIPESPRIPTEDGAVIRAAGNVWVLGGGQWSGTGCRARSAEGMQDLADEHGFVRLVEEGEQR